MITTYTVNDLGEHPDLMQLVVDPNQIADDGSFHSFELSKLNEPSKLQGFTFIVDENTINQIDKLVIKMNGFKPVLDIKEGEVFDDKAYLSTVQQRIALLEEQLNTERAKLNE